MEKKNNNKKLTFFFFLPLFLDFHRHPLTRPIYEQPGGTTPFCHHATPREQVTPTPSRSRPGWWIASTLRGVYTSLNFFSKLYVVNDKSYKLPIDAYRDEWRGAMGDGGRNMENCGMK